MSVRAILLRSLLLLSTVALCVTAQTTTNTNTYTRDYVFPPVGLGGTETASITVVNTATSSSAEGGQSGQAPSCTGTISFSNASGTIGTPKSFTVGANGFDTVTLSFADAGLTGSRGEILGKVSLTLTAGTPAPCSLSFSLETYDSTTFATHVVMSNSISFGVPVVTPFER